MPSGESVFEEVRRLVAEVADLPPDQVTTDATFAQLGIDSLRGLRIVVEIEKRYGIVISEPEIVAIKGMQDVFGLVEARTRKE